MKMSMLPVSHNIGKRVQITGPDNRGEKDLQGIAGTVIDYSPITGTVVVEYYDALTHYVGERVMPADSVEEIS